MYKMNLKKTLLFFGLPGLLMFFNTQFLLPKFLEGGMVLAWAFFICLWSPCILMTIVIIAKWKLSGIVSKEYFWLNSISLKVIFLSIAIFIVIQVFELFISGSMNIMVRIPGFSPPEFFPGIFKPGFEIAIPLNSFMGIELKGSPHGIVFWFFWILVNIGCEELLWRGYALPRMERYFGRWAWLINGLLWNFFIHLFFRWSYIALLPISLLLPWICQKTRSMWPGFIIHGIGNLLLFAILIPSSL